MGFVKLFVKYIFGFLIVIIYSNVYATHGINLIGFGGESIGMAGADIAVSRDTTALNINPAGLYQIKNKRLDVYSALSHAIELNHSDEFGNQNEKVENDLIFFGDLGYAKKLQDKNITVGVGVFAQGGVGVDYGKLKTAFGTRDDLSTLFRIVRFTPGFSWQLNGKLAVGTSAIITYSDLEQKFFPNTSVLNPLDPNLSFFGLDIEDAYTIEPGFKLGLMYEISDKTKLGISYTSEVELDLEDGEADVNLTALGLGIVKYNEVEASGIDQPQELGIGLSHQLNNKLLLSFEFNWINWEQAIRRSKLVIKDPENSAAPARLVQQADINWRDQYVASIGAEYKLNNKLILRGGYNYARNPIPSRSISPLLGPTNEHHITAGFEYKISDRWSAITTIEYVPNDKNTYTNTQQPFGADSELEVELITLHSLLSRRW